VHYHAGEPRRAIDQLDRTLELDPRFELATFWKGQAYVLLEKHDSARVMLDDVVRSSGRSSLSLTGLAYALARGGDLEGARRLLAEIETRSTERYVPSFEIARVYTALGDRTEALRWLERAAEERSHSIAFLTVDPALAPLRGDPRFEALVRLRSG
jgi:tetratricopeptide (TPR) repeat protein